MEKDNAAKLEGMLWGSRRLLEAVADYVRENAPEGRQREIMLKIGTAMSEFNDLSWMIYREHPGLNPYPEETEIAARMRGANPED